MHQRNACEVRTELLADLDIHLMIDQPERKVYFLSDVIHDKPRYS
jgi:pentose-5-phosphate-3-epimerase